MQETAFLVQFGLKMQILVFDFGVYGGWWYQEAFSFPCMSLSEV